MADGDCYNRCTTRRKHEWQTLPQKRRKDATKPDKGRPAKPTTNTVTNTRIIIGRTTDVSIKAARRFASVFASRLDTDVSESSPKRYLESILKVAVTVDSAVCIAHIPHYI